MDKASPRSYFLKFIIMLFALSAAIPLTYAAADFCNVPFHVLMPVLYVSICVMLFIDFHGQKRAALYCFLLRFVIAVIAGFILFSYIPLLLRFVITAYIVILLSITAYAVSGNFHNVSILCLSMLAINVVIGVIIRAPSVMPEHEQLYGILIIISTVSILSFFLIINIDDARWFGPDRLNIPDNMKRSSFIILAIVSVVIALVSFSSIIVEAVKTFFIGIFRLIIALIELLAPSGRVIGAQQPAADQFFGFEGDAALVDEATHIHPVIIWIIIGASFAVLATLIVFALIKVIRFLIKIFRTERSGISLGNEVFTEIIEKITPNRKKRTLREYVKQARYSSLQTDRERILYIYRVYVKRAKRSGFTHDGISDTANEVLDEITQNANRERFPLPDDLNKIFNVVRYSNDINIPVDTDELKRRLL